MIAKMSKYDLILYAAQRDDFIDKLRGLGLVDITTTGWEPSDEDRQLLLAIEQHARAVEALERFRGSDRFSADAGAFASGEEAFEAYRAATQRAASIGTEIARLQKTAAELRPWGDFSPEALRRLSEQGVVVRCFFTPRATYEREIGEWAARHTIEPIHEGETNVYFVVITRPGEEVVLDAQEVKLPEMDSRQAEAEIARAERELAELDREFSRAALSVDAIRRHGGELRRRLESVRVEHTARREADGTLVLLEGWAEEATSGKVDALLAEYPNVIYLKSTPTPEDDTPVKLRNRPFAHLFEVIGAMYAMPKYGTIDLTRFFAPFYMIFFGFCLAEGGYGLLILLGGLYATLLGRRRGSRLIKEIGQLTMLCGGSGMLFGLASGSFFGLQMSEWTWLGGIRHHLLTPEILFPLSIGMGAVQVLFAMVINAYVTARSFGFRYALALIGWILVLVSSAAAGLLPESVGFTFHSPAYLAVLGIGLVLMFFFNSPGKNPLVNLGLGLWNTYNNVSGLVGDLLSYIRLFAIGLSGGILAMVFNQLAVGMSPDIPVVKQLVMLLILLLGHGINLFMCVLSSFVHPLRLTFVEFYKNAGFEASTRIFDPLKND
ncbi:MAG: V-type ATP synthase subunit I [Alistipes sp.]|nr:V-type ATP synthase subunit I [Alistipes sp.]